MCLIYRLYRQSAERTIACLPYERAAEYNWDRAHTHTTYTETIMLKAISEKSLKKNIAL